MDMEMPKMDGVTASTEIGKMIKDGELSSKIKIIGLTGNENESAIKKCLEAGMVDVIVKPVCKDKLEEILLKHRIQ